MIEGLEHLEKDGWELVRFDCVSPGECYVGHDSEAWKWNGLGPSSAKHIIIRRIEKPKQYRPFANAAEFAPHRDRWIRRVDENGNQLAGEFQIDGFDDRGIWSGSIRLTYKEALDRGAAFDDGSPFGVEVQS